MKITKVDCCEKISFFFNDITIGAFFRRRDSASGNFLYIKINSGEAMYSSGGRSFRHSADVHSFKELIRVEICEITWTDKKD